MDEGKSSVLSGLILPSSPHLVDHCSTATNILIYPFSGEKIVGLTLELEISMTTAA